MCRGLYRRGMARVAFVGVGDTDPGIDEMERTHELARTIGAPDLTPTFLKRDAENGKASPATHSARFARALGEGARRAAKKSISRRRVKGWCNKGHELTPDNTKRRQCRLCENTRRRARRALGLAA